MTGWKGWAALGGHLMGAAPAAAYRQDGSLAIFAMLPGPRGPQLGYTWQTAPNLGWTDWNVLGALPSQVSGTVKLAANHNGLLEAFVVAGNSLWHMRQTDPTTGWSSWEDLGLAASTQFMVGSNLDGRLEAFAVAPNGELTHIWQLTPDAKTWGAVDTLGTPPSVSIGELAVINNEDGRLELFTIGGDAAVWNIWQETPNGRWSSWNSLNQPRGNTLASIAVSRNADGRLDLFVVAGGTLGHIWQLTPNAGWGTWDNSLGKPDNLAQMGVPNLAQNMDGRLELFVPDASGATWHIWQVEPNSGWSSWESLGGEPATVLSGRNADGRLEVFAQARTPGQVQPVWHRWQVTQGGNWSDVNDWEQLSADSSARTIFSGAGNDILVLSDSGVVRSDDMGASWADVAIDPAPSIVTVDPADGAILYAGANGSVLKSINGGGAWTPILSIPNQRVIALAVSGADAKVMYAAVVHRAEFRLLRTTDAGAAWATVLGPEPSSECSWTAPILATHRTDPTRVFRTDGCYAARNVQFGDALRQSIDQGASWRDLFHVMPLFPTKLVGGSGGQPLQYYLSASSGASTGGGAVFRSDDDGATWTAVLSLDSGPGVRALAQDTAAPERVYAGLTSGAVHATADAGATWTQAGRGDVGEVHDLGISADGAYVFAATSRGVWRLPR